MSKKFTLIINTITRDYKNLTQCLWSFYDTYNDDVEVVLSIPEYVDRYYARLTEYGDILKFNLIKSQEWLSPNEVKNLSQRLCDTSYYLYIEDNTIFKDEHIFEILENAVKNTPTILSNKAVAFPKGHYFNVNMTGYGYENFYLTHQVETERISELLYERKCEHIHKIRMKENLDFVYNSLQLTGEKRNYFQYC